MGIPSLLCGFPSWYFLYLLNVYYLPRAPESSNHIKHNDYPVVNAHPWLSEAGLSAGIMADLSAGFVADLSAFGLVCRNYGGGSRHRGPACPVKCATYLTGVGMKYRTGVKFLSSIELGF